MEISKRGRRREGRPTLYTKKLGLEICARLALGESLLHICEEKEMPTTAAVYNWLFDGATNEDGTLTKQEFIDNYQRARSAQAEKMFDEMLDIADNGTNDWMERHGEMVEDKEVTNRSKLRVETRKWYLSKVLPKKFGDKVDLTSGNEPIKGNTIILSDFNATNGQS